MTTPVCWIGSGPLTPIVRSLTGLIVVLTVLVGPATGLDAEPRVPSSVIGDLKDIQQFSELFNRDAGHLRLVLLLSPT